MSIPDEFNQKLFDFVVNDTIMRTRSATAYTEEFIINEMQKDWWISKQNQLLFIWSKIYAWISQKKLYNWLDDTNEDRRSEYKKTLRQIANCYDEYKKWFKTYMETKSAEADRRSAEADRRSAEYKKQSAEADRRSAEIIKEIKEDAPSWIKEMVKYYNLCIKSPETNDENEMRVVKNAAKDIIQTYKKFWIDYKALILKEVWDKKKVDNVLKFYGVK